MIYEQGDKLIESHIIASSCLFSKTAISHFISHVFDLLLCRVVSHCTHKVFKLIDWYFTIKLSSESCIFFFASNHRIVEEVVHILESLAIAATLNESDEWLNTVTSKGNCLLYWCNIYLPDVHS